MRKLIARFFLTQSKKYSDSGLRRMLLFEPGMYGYALGEFHSAVSELYRSLAKAFYDIDGMDR